MNIEDILLFISNNQILIISILIFFLCVIIGYYGDAYFKKTGKLESIKKQDKEKSVQPINETSNESKQEDDEYDALLKSISSDPIVENNLNNQKLSEGNPYVFEGQVNHDEDINNIF